MIVFNIQSTRSCNVHYDGKEMNLKTGSKMAFVYGNGTWENIYEASYKTDRVVHELISNKTYGSEVNEFSQLKLMKNDKEGDRIHKYLENGNLHIFYLL